MHATAFLAKGYGGTDVLQNRFAFSDTRNGDDGVVNMAAQMDGNACETTTVIKMLRNMSVQALTRAFVAF